MSLIEKKLVTERETASYKLDRATLELVRFYSEFIGSPQEHVVNEALRFVFRKDKEFSQWLKARNKVDLLAVPLGGVKEKVRTVASANSAAPAIEKKS
jgi:hypothetical protein